MKVLFIGNSFTARNDLPDMIRALAEERGHAFESRLIWAGGASLRKHWNRGEAKQAIETGAYDLVVLQEQSTLPVKNPARMHENVRLFDSVIRASGAKTCLYMTWARLHEPDNQDRITVAYRTIAEELGAILVPAGAAWQKYLAERSSPPLHDADGSHPSVAGTYLAACVFFATLFGESPLETKYAPDGLSADAADVIRRAACPDGTML